VTRWIGSSCSEEGSVTIVAAGTIVLAAVLVLVCVDLFRALDARARAQTAADAAALAAAQQLVVPGTGSPEEKAAEYASRNGASLLSCSCQPGSLEAVVSVEVPVRLVFLAPARRVTASARAVVDGTASAFGPTRGRRLAGPG
jgi:secretion/DNA translocation related TadE-like protein